MLIYDLAIVGAGISGCIAAKIAAKKGLNVCLIECKPEDKIGDKICGDAISKHHFDSLGMSYPSGQERESEIKGVKLHSPDLRTVFKVEDEKISGFGINRRIFGQRLLKEALDSGLIFYDNTLATEPISSDGFVEGVKVRNLKKGRKREIRSKITLDASGFSAVLRRNLPSTPGIEKFIEKQDFMSCYREIRDNVDYETKYCEIFLTQEIAPGGYYWIFPRGEGKVNVGLGVQPLKSSPNPRDGLYKHVLSGEIFSKSTAINSGGGFVPTRRPLDSFVSNGIMLLGDAACLVNPIHGGGIGPSMLSGKLAAEVAVSALSKGPPSTEILWEYNTKYMRGYGAKQASLDIFRIFLQSIKDDGLNYGMRRQLIKEKEVLESSMKGEVTLSIAQKAERVLRGLRRLDLLMNLKKNADKMKQIKELYENYPEREGLDEWLREVKIVYES